MIAAQIVAGAFDFEQLDRRGNERDRTLKLIRRPEWIARSVHEQCRGLQLGKMRRPQLPWFAGWMQGIREQKEPIGQPGSFGRQYTGLPSAIRMTAEPNLFRLLLADFRDLLAKSLAIPSRIAWARRSVRPLLAERQIIAHNLNAMFRENMCERNEQWRVSVRSSAVGEQQVLHERLRISDQK